MKLELKEAVDFKKCIDAINVLIDEAELIVGADGLELKATDPSQISMIDFSMPKTAFAEYSAEKEIHLGLDLDYLSQVLNRSKSDDSLTIELNEGDSSLKLSFSGSSKRNFSIPLIDVTAGKLPTPRIDFDAVIEMNSNILSDALKDASLISTHITLEVNEKEFRVYANSSKGKVENNTSKKEFKEFKVKNSAKAMFPLDYLSDMLKGSGKNLTLSMKSDAPIKLNYKINEAELTYFLAPRIESE
ncbi:MAG: proliferating cell nuclear antigen (pcna) [Candidatus Diapherotrites archaeon]|nr:proliferating cell nuclear antigen (pcna) [Candidatus Diapherotrites archaeon]